MAVLGAVVTGGSVVGSAVGLAVGKVVGVTGPDGVELATARMIRRRTPTRPQRGEHDPGDGHAAAVLPGALGLAERDEPEDEPEQRAADDAEDQRGDGEAVGALAGRRRSRTERRTPRPQAAGSRRGGPAAGCTRRWRGPGCGPSGTRRVPAAGCARRPTESARPAVGGVARGRRVAARPGGGVCPAGGGVWPARPAADLRPDLRPEGGRARPGAGDRRGQLVLDERRARRGPVEGRPRRPPPARPRWRSAPPGSSPCSGRRRRRARRARPCGRRWASAARR